MLGLGLSIGRNAFLSTILSQYKEKLRAAGLLSKAVVLDPFASGASDIGLTNLATNGINASQNNSPTFVANKGFLGSSSPVRNINLNYNPSVNGSGVLGQNNMTIIIGVQDDVNETNQDFGTGTITGGSVIFSRSNNNFIGSVNAQTNQSLISTGSKRYFAVSRKLATEIEMYKNNVMLPVSSNSDGVANANLYANGGLVNSGNNKTISIVGVFTYLTPSEIKTFIKLTEEYLANFSNNIISFQTAIDFNTVSEGHSFMQLGSFNEDAINARINTTNYYIGAVGGTNIASMVAREAVCDSKLIVETATYRNIEIVWAGTNDIFNTVGTGTNAYYALRDYCIERVSAGWKVFAFTCVPKASIGAIFDAERIIFNNLMRNDLALYNNIYVLNTDSVSQLDDPTNTTYYSDGTHLTAAGALVAAPLIDTPIASYLAQPFSILSLSLISGGVQLNWTYTSGGTAQTEIWGKIGTGSYSLLYTIAAGTTTKNDVRSAVDFITYKIRTKNGAVYGDFSKEMSICMCGDEILINGYMSLDANWNKASGVTFNTSAQKYVSNGATSTFTQILLQNNAKIINGKTYKIEFDITNYVSGNWKMCLGGLTVGATSAIYSANGHYVVYLTTNNIGIDPTLSFLSWSASPNMSIDNCSLKIVTLP